MANQHAQHRTTGAKKGERNPPVQGAVNRKEKSPHDAGESQVHNTGTVGLAMHEIPVDPNATGFDGGMLDAPPARPGKVQRWVRVRIGGGNDAQNIQASLRGGWRPRLANTVGPEHSPPTLFLDGHEYIGVGDVVLMERDKALDRKEREAEEARIRRQNQAVQEQLQSAQQPGGPQINVGQKTTVTRGNRRPAVQRDSVDTELADSEIDGGEEMRTGSEDQDD